MQCDALLPPLNAELLLCSTINSTLVLIKGKAKCVCERDREREKEKKDRERECGELWSPLIQKNQTRSDVDWMTVVKLAGKQYMVVPTSPTIFQFFRYNIFKADKLVRGTTHQYI